MHTFFPVICLLQVVSSYSLQLGPLMDSSPKPIFNVSQNRQQNFGQHQEDY